MMTSTRQIKFLAKNPHRLELLCHSCTYDELAAVARLANRDDIDEEMFKIDSVESIRVMARPNERRMQLVTFKIHVRRERLGRILSAAVLVELSEMLGCNVAFES